MSRPITKPGWYRAWPGGLVFVATLDEQPADTTELVKVELDGQMTEDPLF